MLSTDPGFTGVDGTAGGEEETGSGELWRRRCEKGRWRQRRRRRLEQWRQELGFASLFKHLRINPNRWIGDERTEEAGFWWKTAQANFLAHLTSIFFFFTLLHFCEIIYKNNYFIYINIFFICNRLHIGYSIEVSKIFELIYYFLYVKWISKRLSKLVPNWLHVHLIGYEKLYKNYI